MKPDLHNAIMNLPAKNVDNYGERAFRLAYKEGHRDARHQAAELVASVIEQAPPSVDLSECASLLAHVYEHANGLSDDVLERIGKMSVALQQAISDKDVIKGIKHA